MTSLTKRRLKPYYHLIAHLFKEIFEVLLRFISEWIFAALHQSLTRTVKLKIILPYGLDSAAVFESIVCLCDIC
jgi:hypothetical protein